jgi:hypothetical protein
MAKAAPAGVPAAYPACCLKLHGENQVEIRILVETECLMNL